MEKELMLSEAVKQYCKALDICLTSLAEMLPPREEERFYRGVRRDLLRAWDRLIDATASLENSVKELEKFEEEIKDRKERVLREVVRR